jgi:hypothetical protein
MSRASATMRGAAVRIPGTSFQSTTRGAPRARPSSVAVRSDPPRPSVAMLPSGARPMKPGTTAAARCASRGRSSLRAFRVVSGRPGAAPPC